MWAPTAIKVRRSLGKKVRGRKPRMKVDFGGAVCNLPIHLGGSFRSLSLVAKKNG
jgi:hypothetical protein